MAWTTSANLRVRPTFGAATAAGVKQARQFAAHASRAVNGNRNQAQTATALTILSLGALAPVLPASVTASALLLSGSILVALGAGANLASATRPNKNLSGADISLNDAAADDRSASPPQGRISSYMHAKQNCQSEPPQNAHLQNNGASRSKLDPNHDWADLMARINHELRTPLNAVIGFSEVMSLEMFGPIGNERYQDYVRHINDSAAELLKSAEDTLALTALLTNHRDTVVREVCTLHQAVADAWGFVERKALARGIAIESAINADIEVLNEPRALRQIFVNLLSEAITRSADGSTVSLVAVADGELIEVVATVKRIRTERVERSGSLAIGLARTLLEMQGTSLLEIEPATGGWTAVTVLDRAAQRDLFASRATTAPVDAGKKIRRYA